MTKSVSQAGKQEGGAGERKGGKASGNAGGQWGDSKKAGASFGEACGKPGKARQCCLVCEWGLVSKPCQGSLPFVPGRGTRRVAWPATEAAGRSPAAAHERAGAGKLGASAAPL